MTQESETDSKYIDKMSISEKQEHDSNAWRIFVNKYRNCVDKQNDIDIDNEQRKKIMNKNNPK